MIDTAFRGLPPTYLPDGTRVPTDAGVANLDETEDRILAGHPRMRRVLMRLLPSFPLLLYYLHVSDGTDLHGLDAKVANGTATDDDLRGALLGEARSVVCLHCSAVIRAIVVDTGHPLFAADRSRRLREHTFRRRCPVCGGHLSLYVLEIIDGLDG